MNKIIKVLISGAFARLISLASLPFVARLYSPDDFGVLALVTSLSLIFAPFLSLRLVLLLPKYSGKELQKNLRLNISLVVQVFSIFLTVWVVSFFVIAQAFEYRYPSFYLLVPFLALLGALYEVNSVYLAVEEKTRLISLIQISQAVFESASKIVLGVLFVPVSLSLVVGYFLYLVIPALNIILVNVRLSAMERIYFKDTLHYVIKNRKYVYTRFPSQVLLSLTMQYPIIAAAYLFDSSLVGQYAVVLAILAVPVALMVQSVGNIYYAKVTAYVMKDADKAKEYYFTVLGLSFLISALLSVTLFVSSEFLVSIVFGNGWPLVAGILDICLISFVVQLGVAPLMNTLSAIRKDVELLIMNFMRLIFVICVFMIALIESMSFEEYIKLYTIFMFGYYSLIVFWMSVRVLRYETY
jgi:O-antigen/teichoic acid export membrane protein